MALRDLLFAKVGGNGGGGSNTLVITVDEETGALDKTWNEIYTALGAGKYVVSPYAYEDGTEAGQYIGFAAISRGASTYDVYFICHGGGTSVMAVRATASSADGYPVFSN